MWAAAHQSPNPDVEHEEHVKGFHCEKRTTLQTSPNLTRIRVCFPSLLVLFFIGFECEYL